MSDAVIEITDVAKAFGKHKVLQSVSLKVPQGKTYAFLGRNGAGKTTTIRMLLGLLRPDSGRLRVLSLDPTKSAMDIRRRIGYARQREVYGAMFTTSSSALKELAMDRRFLGARIGMLGVLQTWKRNLDFHVHIHYLVPGGGLSPDGKRWLYPRNKEFLVHGKPLGLLFRGKLRDRLKELELDSQVPTEVWRKDWVVDCVPVGDGQRTLKYLGPYVHRVALSDHRISDLQDHQVTFGYNPSGSQRVTTRTLPVLTFITLFLKHVLPRRFMKVRSYGLLASASRRTLQSIRLAVLTSRSQPPQPKVSPTTHCISCPHCGGVMEHVGFIAFPRPPPA